MIDPGSQFRNWMSGEVERIAKRILAGTLSPVAAQQDGVPTSDGHRILNFQGPGVTVGDDPGARRTNVFIPGSPTSSSTVTIASLTTASPAIRGIDLMSSGSNLSEPVDGSGKHFWQIGYTETAAGSKSWGNVVQSPDQTVSGHAGPIPGTQLIVAQANGGVGSRELYRHTFTLPSGTITGATLHVLIENASGSDGNSWLNDHFVGTVPPDNGSWTSTNIPFQTFTISPSWLVAGGSNLLAIDSSNESGGSADLNAGATYQLIVTYGSAGTDTQYQLVSEKDAASGYAGLDAGSLVASSELGSGTPSGSNFLRGDRTWAPASSNSIVIQEVDGTPSVAATGLKMPNSSLTDNGDGTVTYTAPGQASGSGVTGQLSSDVSLSSLNTYFDGPSVTVSAGSWLLVGTVTLAASGAANMTAKLWDGTTVISSAETTIQSNGPISLTLVGYVKPTGSKTYKISVANAGSGTGGLIKAAAPSNAAGNTASTLVASPG